MWVCFERILVFLCQIRPIQIATLTYKSCSIRGHLVCFPCRVVNQFLRTVSYQLLTQPSNLHKVADYLDSKPLLATRGITLETFNKLCGAFFACKQWPSLLSLCHRCLHLIPSSQANVCKPLEVAIKNSSVSEKALSVFERLTEEQKATFSNEVLSVGS